MKIFISDLVLLGQDPVSNVRVLKENGFNDIEIMMDGAFWDNSQEERFELVQELKKFEVNYTVHPPAWDINLTSETKYIRDASFQAYADAIEFAGWLGASHVVIHPGFTFAPEFDKKVAIKHAKESIIELCELANHANVKLAIENVGYNGTSILTMEEYVEFLKEVPEEAGYLIDVGHAQLNGWDIASVIRQTSSRLIALHLHDNDGQGDLHLPIGKGVIEWEVIFHELRDLNLEISYILEYGQNTSLEYLKTGQERLKNELSWKLI
ncbi:sugar phosphate isomerase/epimerase family protein [Lysinibacillus telephonicus]|uniref:sugar phosphate isomerase/epimerase family protein n=1 Tax=Lysinibacillus telephonicus TaxID=1714840 RepID=UPI0037D94988